MPLPVELVPVVPEEVPLVPELVPVLLPPEIDPEPLVEPAALPELSLSLFCPRWRPRSLESLSLLLSLSWP